MRGRGLILQQQVPLYPSPTWARKAAYARTRASGGLVHRNMASGGDGGGTKTLVADKVRLHGAHREHTVCAMIHVMLALLWPLTGTETWDSDLK